RARGSGAEAFAQNLRRQRAVVAVAARLGDAAGAARERVGSARRSRVAVRAPGAALHRGRQAVLRGPRGLQARTPRVSAAEALAAPMAYGTQHWPTEIRLKKAEKRLEIDFDDGAHFSYPAEFLRVESPSAEVQGHGPSQKQIVAGRM